MEFDVAFVAFQERHNDGSQVPFADAVLRSDPSMGIRNDEPRSWITAKVNAGQTTAITIDLDGEMYGNGPGPNDEDVGNFAGTQNPDLAEWPGNAATYFMEANVDVDTDGIDEAANDDDFRVGYAAVTSGARANAIGNSTVGASGDGGYVRRNLGGSNAGDSANRTDVAEEDVPGFTAYERGDQLSYTFILDWSAIAADSSGVTAELSSVPTAIQINEIFGGDGGEGVAASPNSSDDGRSQIDNVTGSSTTLPL